jgi:putative heme-binding domain-containing protein
MSTIRNAIVGAAVLTAGALGPAIAQRGQPAPQRPQPAMQSAADVIPGPDEQFTTLPGFKVERVVPQDRRESLILITFDAQGRPWVSPANGAQAGGPPKQLVDADGDGIYESSKEFIENAKMNTCHGLWWDASVLYGVCRGPREPTDHWLHELGRPAPTDYQAAVFRAEDTNGDDVADRWERVAPIMAGMFDHGPHRIFRAPDNTVTIMLGNNTFAPETHANIDEYLSRIKERDFLPEFKDNWGMTRAQGTFVRLDIPSRRYEILFGGMRNAVGYAYNLLGEMFYFDSDMEPEIGVPWYRPVRTAHGVPNADFGFRYGSNKFPSDYFDTLPGMRNEGRGSPTGVVIYQAHAYPAEWHDVLFEADWSRGRILYSRLTPSGATYTMRSDLAEFVHGDPLPVSDMEVGPDGMLYFTTGGNGAEGGLFRVRYVGTAPVPKPDLTGIYAVTRQAQPLSSWGYAAIEKVKVGMGAATFAAELERVARNRTAPGEDRFRALLEMQRHGAVPSVELLRALAVDPDYQMRATVVYLAGTQKTDGAKAIAAAALKDAHAFVRRRAAEAIVRQGLSPDTAFAPVADVYALLADSDRFVRFAGRVALERLPRAFWKDRAMAETNPRPAMEALLALNNTAPADADRIAILEKTVEWMRRPTLGRQDRLNVLRMYEIAAVDSKEGAPPTIRRQVHDLLIGQFPGSDWRLNLEIAKVLAYSGEPDVIDKIFAAMPAYDGTPPRPAYLRNVASNAVSGSEGDLRAQQMEYVYALRTITTGWTPAQKEKLLDWFDRATKWRGGGSLSGSLNNLWNASMSFFTEEERKLASARLPTLGVQAAGRRGQPGAGVGGAPGGGGAGGGTGAAVNVPPPAGGGAPPPATTGAPPAGRAGTPPAGGGGGGRGRGGTGQAKDEIIGNLLGNPGRGNQAAPDLNNGKQMFATLCASCHRFGESGNDVGPDLTDVRSRFTRRAILESLFFPSEVIDDRFAMWTIQLRGGESRSGLIVSEDDRAVLLNAGADAPVSIPKAQIASRRKAEMSMMPDLTEALTTQQIRDLVAYLQSGGR